MWCGVNFETASACSDGAACGKGMTYSSGVRIHKMSDVLRHTLRNEQNRNVLPDLSKIKESLFNLPLIGSSLVADVKIRALAAGTLPDS